MGRRREPPSQSRRTFLADHVGQIVAADFFVVPTATYRLLFVLVSSRTTGTHPGHCGHGSSDDGVDGPQLREAFPLDEAPRYLSTIAIMHSTTWRTRRKR